VSSECSSACSRCNGRDGGIGVGTSLLADAVKGDYGGVADLEPLAEGVLYHRRAEGQCERDGMRGR
jgi:hypothetical protein